MHLANHERQERCYLPGFRILCAPTVSRTRFVKSFFPILDYTENTNVLKVNLVVGDYFKVETIYVAHSKLACELIGWLRSKTYVLAHLREVQVQSGRQPLTVIRAVLTRWMAHYLAFKRLLELQHPLQALVTHDAIAPADQHYLIPPGSTTANKKKAHEMIAVIRNASFWHSLARCEIYLT